MKFDTGNKDMKINHDFVNQKLNKNTSTCFIYNGLDRVNSNLLHDYYNVMPCCPSCNFAKRNLELHIFLDWMSRIKDNYNNLLQKINLFESK